MSLNITPSKNVTEALNTRITVRDFLDTPVPDDVLKTLFETARRTPSGGNLQPWRIHVMTGAPLDAFRDECLGKLIKGDMEEQTFPGYPSPLWEPQRSWRYKLGEDMYGLLGIAKDDKPGRMRWLGNNVRFFGAPVGLSFNWYIAYIRRRCTGFIPSRASTRSTVIVAAMATLRTKCGSSS